MTPQEPLAAAEDHYDRGMRLLHKAAEAGNAAVAERDIAVATAHFAAGQLALMIGVTTRDNPAE